MKYRHAVAEVSDDVEIVFDHEDRMVFRNGADELGNPADIFLPHTCHGLIEQKNLRFERQRCRNLKHALAAVREIGSKRVAMSEETGRRVVRGLFSTFYEVMPWWER